MTTWEQLWKSENHELRNKRGVLCYVVVAAFSSSFTETCSIVSSQWSSVALFTSAFHYFARWVRWSRIGAKDFCTNDIPWEGGGVSIAETRRKYEYHANMEGPNWFDTEIYFMIDNEINLVFKILAELARFLSIQNLAYLISWLMVQFYIIKKGS